MWFFIGSLAIIFLICLSFIGFIIVVEAGYLDKYEKIRRLKTAAAIVFRLVDNIATALKPKNLGNYTINDSRKSISIHYSVNGLDKLIQIPFNPKLVPKMMQWKVYLIKNKSPIEITQQGGVPYICTAGMLGGTEIIAKNTLTGKVIHYEGDVIPGFLNLSQEEFSYFERPTD